MALTLSLPVKLASALEAEATQRGVAPEVLAIEALSHRFSPDVEPIDEWERRLFGAAIDCGVSVPHDALSSDGLYE